MQNWWDEFYDPQSIMEVSWDTGSTVEEIQDEIDSTMTNYEGYSFVEFVVAKPEFDSELLDMDLDRLAVVDYAGTKFLAQFVKNKIYDVGEEVRTTLGLDDPSDPNISTL